MYKVTQEQNYLHIGIKSCIISQDLILDYWFIRK